MESLINWVILIASFLGAVGAIIATVNKVVTKAVEKAQKPIYDLIKETHESTDSKIKEIDMSQCKNYLVGFLKEVENGEIIDEVEKERAYEVFDHYSEIGGNSYIHDKWERLMKKESCYGQVRGENKESRRR